MNVTGKDAPGSCLWSALRQCKSTTSFLFEPEFSIRETSRRRNGRKLSGQIEVCCGGPQAALRATHSRASLPLGQPSAHEKTAHPSPLTPPTRAPRPLAHPSAHEKAPPPPPRARPTGAPPPAHHPAACASSSPLAPRLLEARRKGRGFAPPTQHLKKMFAIRSLCQSHEPARLRQDSFQYRNNVQSHWSDTLRGPRAGFGSAIPPRSQNRSLVRLRACSPSIQGASHTHWSRASGLFHTSRAVGHLGGRSTPFLFKSMVRVPASSTGRRSFCLASQP